MGDDTTLIPSDPSFLARLIVGMLVSGPAGIQPGIRILKINSTSITLTGAVPTSTGDNYTFSGGISDPYTSTLANLWYGWAEYYRASNPSMPDIPFSSQVSPRPALVRTRSAGLCLTVCGRGLRRHDQLQQDRRHR